MSVHETSGGMETKAARSGGHHLAHPDHQGALSRATT